MLVTRITCGSCGRNHRIHRNLAGGSRYRFTCKHCGAEVIFSTNCVRWAFSPRPRGWPPGSCDGTASWMADTRVDSMATVDTVADHTVTDPTLSDHPVADRTVHPTVADHRRHPTGADFTVAPTVADHTVAPTVADHIPDHAVVDQTVDNTVTVVEQTVPEVIVHPPLGPPPPPPPTAPPPIPAPPKRPEGTREPGIPAPPKRPEGTRGTGIPAPPRRPEGTREPEIPTHDTMVDRRAPIHLSPLVRRGVTKDRESSRVRWLRGKRGAA